MGVFKRTLTALALFSLSAFPSGLTDYMRDSLSNIDTNLALKYYSTQERGYFLGGSWHYRVRNFSIYPFTITPPSIKAGCGGIDIILGGFSYVQPEYLVQLLQNLIQAAPAVAFEIALDTFAPQVRQIIDDITALINMINQLNFNSCQAINGIKTWIENNFLKNKESTAGENAAREQASGSSESFWGSLQKWYEDFKGKFDKLVKDLKGISLQSTSGNSTSIDSNSLVEDALKNTQIGSDSQIAALIRGILGDVKPSNAIAVCKNDRGGSTYVPPPANTITEEYLTKWIEGSATFTGMDANGNPVTISFSSIKDRVKNDIQALYNDMVSGRKPDPSRYLYLAYADIPVIAYLKLLSATGDPDLKDILNDQMADLITLAVVYGTLKAILKAEINEMQSLANAYRNQYTQAACVSEAVWNGFKEVLKNYTRFVSAFSNAYYKIENKRRLQIVRFMNNYKQLQQTLYRRVSEILPEGAL